MELCFTFKKKNKISIKCDVLLVTNL